MFMSFCMCKFNLSRHLYVGRSYKPDFIVFENVCFSYTVELDVSSRYFEEPWTGTLEVIDLCHFSKAFKSR